MRRSRHLGRGGFLLGAAVFGVSCSAASSLPGLGTTTSVATTAAPSFAELVTEGDAYEVRLGAVGAPPGRALVVAHPIGAVSTYEILIAGDGAEVAGAVEVEVLASAADASSERLEVRLVEISMTGVPADEVEAGLGASLGIVRDRSRVMTEVVRSTPDGLTRRADLATGSLLDAVELGVVPLPIPLVGDGSTWTIRRTTTAGAVVETGAAMSIVERDGVGMAEVRHPVDPAGALRTDAEVRAIWYHDGGGPFGAAATIEFAGTTISWTRR